MKGFLFNYVCFNSKVIFIIFEWDGRLRFYIFYLIGGKLEVFDYVIFVIYGD